MKHKYLLFSICFILMSCKNTKEEYYPNGTIAKEYELKNGKLDGVSKEYYENGKLKAIYLLKDGVLVDSSLSYNKEKSFIEKINYYLPKDSIRTKFFHEKEKISSTGIFYNNQKSGKWKYFNKNGELEKVFEYKNIESKQYTNQGWYFDSRGDTLKNLGNYYILKPIPKTIQSNKTLSLDFEYKPILALNSEAIIYMSSKINNDFSNLGLVTLDAFPLYSNKAILEMSFKSKGKKNLRGFIKEFITNTDKTTKSKNTYFDIPIIVK